MCHGHPLTEAFIDLGLAITQLVISLKLIPVNFSVMDFLPHSKDLLLQVFILSNLSHVVTCW